MARWQRLYHERVARIFERSLYWRRIAIVGEDWTNSCILRADRTRTGRGRLRNLRKKEGLSLESELLGGDVPKIVDAVEHGVRYLAAPWTGQKTGAFLDQRENRAFIGARAHGRAT